MIRRPPRSTQSRSSAASDVYKRQGLALFLVALCFDWVTASFLKAVPHFSMMDLSSPTFALALAGSLTILSLVAFRPFAKALVSAAHASFVFLSFIFFLIFLAAASRFFQSFSRLATA